MNQIFTAAKNLFALPLEKKNAIDIHNSPFYCGYFGMLVVVKSCLCTMLTAVNHSSCLAGRVLNRTCLIGRVLKRDLPY